MKVHRSRSSLATVTRRMGRFGIAAFLFFLSAPIAHGAQPSGLSVPRYRFLVGETLTYRVLYTVVQHRVLGTKPVPDAHETDTYLEHFTVQSVDAHGTARMQLREDSEIDTVTTGSTVTRTTPAPSTQTFQQDATGISHFRLTIFPTVYAGGFGYTSLGIFPTTPITPGSIWKSAPFNTLGAPTAVALFETNTVAGMVTDHGDPVIDVRTTGATGGRVNTTFNGYQINGMLGGTMSARWRFDLRLGRFLSDSKHTVVTESGPIGNSGGVPATYSEVDTATSTLALVSAACCTLAGP